MKEGDKVKCVNTISWWHCTEDKIYEVLNDDRLYIIDDDSDRRHINDYFRDFEVVDNTKPKDGVTNIDGHIDFYKFDKQKSDALSYNDMEKRCNEVRSVEPQLAYSPMTFDIHYNEENKMEDITNFNKENIKLARAKVEQERATFEVEAAANKYRHLLNIKEHQERIIREANKILAENAKELAMFEGDTTTPNRLDLLKTMLDSIQAQKNNDR